MPSINEMRNILKAEGVNTRPMTDEDVVEAMLKRVTNLGRTIDDALGKGFQRIEPDDVTGGKDDGEL